MRPYYEQDGITIYHGDCRDVLPSLGPVDLVLADPPYGETSLAWDVPVEGWLHLLDSPQLWCFGSLRMFLAQPLPGWRMVQDIVWEKHNGSSFHADRFKRVHELLVHFVRAGTAWADLYHQPVYTADATAWTLRRKQRPPHTGHIEAGAYTSEDGGPRLMRSVQYVRSCHGYAEHPTQKPVGIVSPVVEYSCPPSGIVLDPFMGSGTMLLAAKSLGRRAVGVEIEERYCEIAAERLSQGVLDFGVTA